MKPYCFDLIPSYCTAKSACGIRGLQLDDVSHVTPDGLVWVSPYFLSGLECTLVAGGGHSLGRKCLGKKTPFDSVTIINIQ